MRDPTTIYMSKFIQISCSIVAFLAGKAHKRFVGYNRSILSHTEPMIIVISQYLRKVESRTALSIAANIFSSFKGYVIDTT